MDKFQVIMDLMKDLQEEMKYSGDDLDERLGKPKVEVLKVEGKIPMDEDMPEKEMVEEDMDFDDEEGMFKPKSEGMDLKKRLMNLRGK